MGLLHRARVLDLFSLFSVDFGALRGPRIFPHVWGQITEPFLIIAPYFIEFNRAVVKMPTHNRTLVLYLHWRVYCGKSSKSFSTLVTIVCYINFSLGELQTIHPVAALMFTFIRSRLKPQCSEFSLNYLFHICVAERVCRGFIFVLQERVYRGFIFVLLEITFELLLLTRGLDTKSLFISVCVYYKMPINSNTFFKFSYE